MKPPTVLLGGARLATNWGDSRGTGNDYAKIAGTVGLPAAIAVDRLARGRVRYLDVGIAWEEYFLNAIGLGFDADVARYMNSNPHAGGLAGYLHAVVRVLRDYRPFRAEVLADDGNSFTDGLMLLEVGIGNVVGGGFRLTPDAQPDDGLFDVYAIRQVSIPGLLLRLPLTIPGWHTRLRVVRSFRTATLTVIGLDGPRRSAGRRGPHPRGPRKSGRACGCR
jgi:diacylglycerol kinase family enzyme